MDNLFFQTPMTAHSQTVGGNVAFNKRTATKDKYKKTTC
ncbi:MAG: hypothetical protein UZ12_BCD005001656 [Bacteroidetes bacterium OLB12]|nr:MAG: hypothetical protein UZ12_BCD005001656 [Bacteroidetes bacterium OLB12]